MIAPGSAISETVCPTIDPVGAAGVPWQVVVVGAGPAGAAAAWRLAARGVRVLLLDRHALPRGKVCGCCLSSPAIRELVDLGTDAMPDTAVPLAAVRLASRGRCVRVPLPTGRVISREAFDAHLVRRAIAAGCHWLPEVDVAAIHDGGGNAAPLELHLARSPAREGRGAVLGAERVVLAAGLVDHVRITGDGPSVAAVERTVDLGSRIGVGCVLPATASNLPDGELVMAVGRSGYCGVVRLEDGRLDVAAAIDRAALVAQRDPARAVAAVLREALGRSTDLGLVDEVSHAATVRATPPLTRRAPVVAGASQRILRIGDAAGYVEPFTGEGIGWALASARMVVAALVAPPGLRAAAEAASCHATSQRRHFQPLHARCRAVAWGLRRPAVVAAALAAADAMPWVARRVVPMVTGARGGGGGR